MQSPLRLARLCLVRPCVVLGAALALSPLAVTAAEVTLRVHHFLPPVSPAQVDFIEPWAERVQTESDGRIEVQIFPAMQLGGRPPQLYDQVRDGIADVVWTLLGYTPGRFPIMEVFELPFMPATAEASSQAVQEFYETQPAAQAEFQDIHPLVFFSHAPGLFHMNNRPIQRLEDLQGAKIRAPSRVTNNLLETLGATPVGMPVPQVPEALSRGVIDGAVIPYEVTRPLRVHELTNSHTYVGEDRGLYTVVFLFGMNRNTYDSLPDDLKAVIDANSGMDLAHRAGQSWDAVEEPGRRAAEELDDAFYTIEGEELERWVQASQPVIDRWIAEMDGQGHDGRALVDAARELIRKYAGD